MAADFNPRTHPRNLVIVLGDQLDRESTVWEGFDPDLDAVWMAENAEEATHVWCHKLRLAFFFSAMRHFRDDQQERGRHVHYHELSHRPSDDRGKDFADLLSKDVHRLRPGRLILCRPGDHRVETMLAQAAEELEIEMEVRPDQHFYVSVEEFSDYARGRKRLILENFYRKLRRKHKYLLTPDGKPVGGEWNYDKQNRESFTKEGPDRIKRPRRFKPDSLTESVIEIVEKRFTEHPGRLDHFDLPVTHDEARAYLRDFVEHRLEGFGTYEDAMWSDNAFLYHSRLSAALNVKLLSPRACVEKAIETYRQGDAPINSVEAFVRQILGWREFVRGIYWHFMPDYAEGNALECDDRKVPGFFWDGETDMKCVAGAMKSLVENAWTHHIPRLMVLGEFALLLGVHPYRFHEWHMAMYVDAVDWVSLPNALGMSQYADGGVVGTKPYCASGNYINRMSNYCRGCRYNPKSATGQDACPFTTLYWDFLDRHHQRFSNNRRMTLQIRNLERKAKEDRSSIGRQADQVRQAIDDGERI